MLLVDDVLLFPVTSLLFVFRKIHEAAAEAIVGEAEAIRRELSEVYMMLETGRITEAEFDAHEKVLLDRLDAATGREEMTNDE